MIEEYSATDRLGPVSHVGRQQIINFRDHVHQAAQLVSTAGEQTVLIGVDAPPIVLDYDRVTALIKTLQNWLDFGSFDAPPPGLPNDPPHTEKCFNDY